jgi:hypothetical protein
LKKNSQKKNGSAKKSKISKMPESGPAENALLAAIIGMIAAGFYVRKKRSSNPVSS